MKPFFYCTKYNTLITSSLFPENVGAVLYGAQKTVVVLKKRIFVFFAFVDGHKNPPQNKESEHFFVFHQEYPTLFFPSTLFSKTRGGRSI